MTGYSLMPGYSIMPPIAPKPIIYNIGNEYVLLINVLAVIISVLAMVYWAKLYRRLYKSDRREVRGWSWLAVAVLGLLLFNVSSIYMVFLTSPIYEMMQVIGRTIVAISMTIGAYLIYSPMKKGMLYKFVPVTPVTEMESSSKSVPTEIVRKGHSYLIDEEKPSRSNEIFVNLVTHGSQGLYITRKYPKDVREDYNLKLTPIIWLTREKTDESHVDPTDIVELSHTIKEFIKKTTDGVVFLDGVEYLITQNDYKEILKFIQSINDSIVTSNSRLIVPLDHSTVDDQQFHLLMREMKTLEAGIRGLS